MQYKLRIAVLGAGRIGSAFAFQLSRVGGHDVTVVARPGSVRLRQLRDGNGVVNLKNEVADVRVIDALDAREYDLVIVAIPAHQIDAVLPELKDSATKSILIMAVTFEPERIEAEIGAERCCFGMPFIQATLDADGKMNSVIGSMGAKSIVGRQRFVDVFNSAGLPAKLEPKMTLWLRSHVPLTIAFESVSVRAVARGGGASWSEAIALVRGMHTCFDVVRSLGFAIYPPGKQRIASSPPWAFALVLWFMSRIASFRTLLATGKLECIALVDSVLAAAAAQSTPTVDVTDIIAMKPAT